MTRGLSPLQVMMLEKIASERSRYRDGDYFDASGIPYRPSQWWGSPTPSQAAACSRALARLERRGLILRQHNGKHCHVCDGEHFWGPSRPGPRRQHPSDHFCGHTTDVVLTSAGRDWYRARLDLHKLWKLTVSPDGAPEDGT